MQKSSCSRLHSQRSIFGGMKNVKHAKRCTKQRRQFYLGDAPHHLDPFYRNLIDSQASRTTDQTSGKGTTLCIS